MLGVREGYLGGRSSLRRALEACSIPRKAVHRLGGKGSRSRILGIVAESIEGRRECQAEELAFVPRVLGRQRWFLIDQCPYNKRPRGAPGPLAVCGHSEKTDVWRPGGGSSAELTAGALVLGVRPPGPRETSVCCLSPSLGGSLQQLSRLGRLLLHPA